MIFHQASRFSAWRSLILGLLTAWIAGAAAARAEPLRPAVILEVFSREGCPHCDDAKQFLADVHRERPDLQIVLHDIGKDPTALKRLQELAIQLGVGIPGVPAFYLQGELLIGYAGPDTTGARLRALLNQSQPSIQEQSTPAEACLPEEGQGCVQENSDTAADSEAIVLPFLGYRLTVHQFGLPLFTLILGLLDGFNPCSMWVLILMLSMLASLKDRLKMVLIAGTFVAVEGLAYFAFMAAWLNMFLFIGLSRVSEVILGVIAGIAGAINLKDFWAFGKGISLSIPAAAKPGVYAKLRRILQAENLTGALVGAVVLAGLVQLVELLCTTGFPALYTRILTLRQLDRGTYYGYLLLYNLAYMLDDVMVLAIGVITLSQRRLQEKEGRWLKLLSGVVMLGLGIYLVVAPQ
ncbi:MAG: glutaredoxin [Deltaproteobacteria bacterium]|nr:glutaredoxin [Deltaproteobacteria bacterium]